MATQQNPVQYGKAIQYQLQSIVTPVPVYAAFNRNFATQTKFIVWMLRNVHQDVYTGPVQSVNGFTISNQILQSLHGYSGLFGGATNGFQIAKADVFWLYNTYDNDEKLAQIFLDCTLDIPT